MLSQVNNSLCTSEESETDTLFKAESREMTPYSRKNKIINSMKRKTLFFGNNGCIVSSIKY